MHVLRWAVYVLFALTSLAWADPSNLCGGVFVAHHVPELSCSGDLCEEYLPYAIHSAEEQITRIDLPPDQAAVWYVISAWDEEKEWCGTEFGFGDFDATAFIFADWGRCAPGFGFELSGDQWPCPNQGTAFTSGEPGWQGSYVPVYWFAGYAYGETVIPLDVDHVSPQYRFGGWATCYEPGGIIESYPAEAYGAMGIHMPGIPVGPSGGISPVETVSWGRLKSMFR